ncbi:hypothetical protein [Streptomyces sp. NPDC056707]|uniref:hypothetical protein n=1 Tax=Streptomyces sp. NPDC056707 TaxID=3345919 RepID=UPI003692CF64
MVSDLDSSAADCLTWWDHLGPTLLGNAARQDGEGERVTLIRGYGVDKRGDLCAGLDDFRARYLEKGA